MFGMGLIETREGIEWGLGLLLLCVIFIGFSLDQGVIVPWDGYKFEGVGQKGIV